MQYAYTVHCKSCVYKIELINVKRSKDKQRLIRLNGSLDELIKYDNYKI